MRAPDARCGASDRGSMLLAMMIAIAISIVVIAGFFYSAGSYFSLIKEREIAGEMLDLRLYIRNTLDCTATLKPATISLCDSSGYVETLKKDLTVQTNKFPSTTSFGANIQTRVSCSKENAGYYALKFDYMDRRKASTGAPPAWVSLFDDIPVYCGVVGGVCPGPGGMLTMALDSKGPGFHTWGSASGTPPTAFGGMSGVGPLGGPANATIKWSSTGLCCDLLLNGSVIDSALSGTRVEAVKPDDVLQMKCSSGGFYNTITHNYF